MARRLSARLSDEACDGWDKWANDQGLTVAALLEAFGLRFAEDPYSRPFDRLPAQIKDTIRLAQEIQHERRRRR